MSPSHSRKAAGQILDISDDLVQGVLNIRTNGVHTFSFQLQNAQRKYDGVLQPMDRIVIEMKRVTWVRVFSGYLNNGPIFSVWPRVLSLQASCTLKRLQFWYWDPTSAAAVTLINSTLGAGNSSANVNDNSASTGPVAFDQAMSKTVIELLRQVVAWPPEKVHMAEIPGNWYDLASKFGDEVVSSLADYKTLIGDFNNALAPQVTGGAGGAAGLSSNGTLQAGSYGGQTYNAQQATNASTIYNVGASRGLPAKAMIIALATAWQESSMQNLNYGDRDSLGLFQQRPSQGWGTKAQIQDPVYSAGKFYDALVKVPGWESMGMAQAAQAVQRSAFPSAYAKWEATATAAVNTLSKTAATATPTGGGAVLATGSAGANLAPAGTPQASGAPGLGTGRAVASAGFSLIKRSPPGTIRYSLGGDDRYDNPNPTVLDCSSFVDWAYYHGVGTPLVPGGRSTARSIAAGVHDVSVATALATKGAVVFLGSRGAEHHVELSLGNGFTAAAHTDGIPIAQQVTVSQAGSSWARAGLMPGVDYGDAATTDAAAAEVAQTLKIQTKTSDPNEFGPNALPGSIGAGGTGTAGDNGAQNAANAQAAAENFAVNLYTWGLQPANTIGESLAGPLAMMNDSPLLPYIAHLMAGCMRSWCSAPNGDFIAWFPDYFGLFGNAAKMNVRSIELLDFTVEWSDQEIVTHQYVVGAPQSMIDGATADVSGVGATSGLNWYASTKGVATMDYPGIFKVIFGEDVSAQFVSDYLSRFGGRPNMVNLPMIASQSRPEFFMALYLFMQRWANQFKANIPMTFMPELWPGMLLCLPEYDFQCYVMEVQHSFQFGKGGGFNTTAKICAPARTSKKSGDIFGLLPLAGSAR